MRAFGILLDRTVKLREPFVPNPRMERVNPPAPRRLDDEITEVFHHACLDNDLEAATEILALVETWHARRQYDKETERQRDKVHTRRMAGELERRHIAAGTRPRVAATRVHA